MYGNAGGFVADYKPWPTAGCGMEKSSGTRDTTCSVGRVKELIEDSAWKALRWSRWTCSEEAITGKDSEMNSFANNYISITAAWDALLGCWGLAEWSRINVCLNFAGNKVFETVSEPWLSLLLVCHCLWESECCFKGIVKLLSLFTHPHYFLSSVEQKWRTNILVIFCPYNIIHCETEAFKHQKYNERAMNTGFDQHESRGLFV